VNQSGRVSVWGLCSDNSVNVWDLETGQVIFSTPPGSNPYQDIQFTTDGGMTALALEGMIILKDTEQGRDIQRLLQISRDAYSTVTGLAISKDGTHLVSGDNNGGLNLWNLTSQENVKAITVTAVSSMGNTIWLPGGDNIVTTNGTSDPISPTLYRIDLRYGSKVVYQSPQLPNHLASSGLAVDLDGNLILAGGGNLSPMESNTSDRPFLWLIDARTGEVKHRLEGHQYNVKAVAFSPDGQYAISGSSSKVQEPHDYSLGELFLWSTSTGQIVRQFTLANDIQGISFSHSGKLIVTCTPVGFYANVSIWDVSTGERKHRYQFGCHEAVFSQDDVSILIDAITSSSLNRIYQINVADGKVLRTFSGLDNTVYTFEISPNYQYLLAASLTNVILWDMLTGRELGRIDLPIPGATTQVTFSTNSKDAYIVQDNANKIFTWHVGEQSTLEQLQIRILKNYYLRPFTCDERELYKDVLPLCSESESEK
jgi:WD40 repeat protein